MLTSFVIVLSVFLQFLTVFFALRLIKITGGVRAWIFISVAISLMGVRRIFSLYEAIVSNPSYQPNLLFELIGLVTSVLMLVGVVLIEPLFRIIKQSEEAQKKLVGELQGALDKVKQLSGMLPICASCKKIRDDKGYWNIIEVYIRNHSEAEFSHGICPECAEKLYPEFYEKHIKNK